MRQLELIEKTHSPVEMTEAVVYDEIKDEVYTVRKLFKRNRNGNWLPINTYYYDQSSGNEIKDWDLIKDINRLLIKEGVE